MKDAVDEEPTAGRLPGVGGTEKYEVLPANAAYYEGIYTVTLNHTVDVVFVPDVSAVAPPWDGHHLPDDLDRVTSAEQARIEMVLTARYAVTPHPRLAGEVEEIPDVLRPTGEDGWPGPPSRPGWVRYVAPAEFDRYAAELPALYEVVPTRFSGVTVSALMAYEVVRFIAEQIVPAPWLTRTTRPCCRRHDPAACDDRLSASDAQDVADLPDHLVGEPHSLSYQAITLTKVPSTTWVESRSTIAARESPMMSAETSGSSEAPRMPR